MGSFAESILRDVEQVKEDINKEVIQKFVSLATDIVNYTPSPSWIGQIKSYSSSSPEFSDGLLANQWYVAENSISSELSSTKSSNGADSLRRIEESTKYKTFYGKDGMLSLANNVDYAYRVETLGYPEGKTDGKTSWKYWNGSHLIPYAMVEKSLIKARSSS